MNLHEILHRLPAVGAGRVFPVLPPERKAAERAGVLEACAVEQRNRRLAEDEIVFKNPDKLLFDIRGIARILAGKHLTVAVERIAAQPRSLIRNAVWAAGRCEDAVDAEEVQTRIPSVEDEHIRHAAAAVRTVLLPWSGNADGRAAELFLRCGVHQRIAGVEIQRAPSPLMVECPAAALRIDRGVDVQLPAPRARIAFERKECRKGLVVSLHTEAHHKLVRLMCGIRLHQCCDQSVPHVRRCMIVECRGPEGTCRECRAWDLRREPSATAEQIPEIIGNILDLRDDLLFLCRDLLGRPCECGTAIRRRPAAPAESLVAELRAAVGALVGQRHDRLLSVIPVVGIFIYFMIV